jgi:hypothetical protein
MTDIHARMLAKPAFVVTRIKKNGIRMNNNQLNGLFLVLQPWEKLMLFRLIVRNAQNGVICGNFRHILTLVIRKVSV